MKKIIMVMSLLMVGCGNNITAAASADVPLVLLTKKDFISRFSATGICAQGYDGLPVQCDLSYLDLRRTIKTIKGNYLDINLEGANTSSCNLSSFIDPNSINTLIEADLTGANLKGAKFKYSNLSNANLTGANLIGADLTGVNLSNANLAGADLTNAILIGADLTNAILTGATLNSANLSQVNLTGANLTNANLNNVKLSKTIFTGANTNGTYFGSTFANGKNINDAIGYKPTPAA